MKHFFYNFLSQIQGLWVRPTVDGLQPTQNTAKKNTIICYVFFSYSLSDLLVIKKLCKKHQIPDPTKKISLPTTSSKKHQKTISNFFYLDPQAKTSNNNTQNFQLALLIDWVMNHPDQDIQLLPVSIFWGRNPEKEKSAIKLFFDWNTRMGGTIKKALATLIHGRNTRVKFSEPLSLQSLISRSRTPNHNKYIRRLLRLQLKQIRTAMIGPEMSHRRLLLNRLVLNDKITQTIQNEIEAGHIKNKEEGSRLAKKYAEELVSDYSIAAIRLMDVLLTWFWNKFYKGIIHYNIDQVRELAKTHTIIYLPCHRSHLDYLLLSYVVYHEGLSPPQIAAGINLNMPIIGRILRKSGAFFMRRKFKDNAIYTAIFHEYLYTLLTKGVSMEYFIEGGRSRTGRTLTPKTGMNSIIIRCMLKDVKRPVSFIPVYIGYEKLLEVETYLAELKGQKKRKESLKDLIKTIVALKDNFGRVCINFGEPLKLKDFLQKNNENLDTVKQNAHNKNSKFYSLINNFSNNLCQRINSAAIINPVNIVSICLLSAPMHTLSENDLKSQIKILIDIISQLTYSKYTIITNMDPKSIIQYTLQLSAIEKKQDNIGNVYLLKNKTAIKSTYYKNNILHLFAIPALLCCIVIHNRSIDKRELIGLCILLYPFLKAELFIEWSETQLIIKIRRLLGILEEQGLIIEKNEKFQSPQSDNEKYMLLNSIARIISQVLERFYLTACVLIRATNNSLTMNQLQTDAKILAQRLNLIYGINSPEFSDYTLFKRFTDQLVEKEYITLSKCEKQYIHYTHEFYTMFASASRMLSMETRARILQVTGAKLHCKTSIASSETYKELLN